MKDFNKIVKTLSKKWWKVIFKRDIFELIDPEYKQEYQSFLDKIIYRLKAEGYIISLKSWVYIIPDESDMKLNSVDLLEKYYLKLLKKYITANVWSQYYISGEKALWFHMKDYSLPKRIYIMNPSLQKKIMIGSYEIHFKSLQWKTYEKKQKLYPLFSKYSKELDIMWLKLKVAWLELALIESALVSDMYDGIDTQLLIRSIKKYWKVFDTDIFYEIGKWKYNMSFNRLKEITKTIDKNLSWIFLDIIKKNWGCFVGEWLRNI